jgi:hypothetical protein
VSRSRLAQLLVQWMKNLSCFAPSCCLGCFFHLGSPFFNHL